jgi:cell division protein FtsZ
MNPEAAPSPNLPPAAGPRLKIIGVGGAGVRALEHLARAGFAEAPLAAVHTDARLLAQTPLATTLLLGQRLTRGLKAGDPEVGRAIAEGEIERLSELCADADLVVVVVGLGGSTGSGVAPVLAQAARETGALVLSLATLPFALEGRRRARQAAVAHRQLRTASDATILLPNEKIAALLAENASLPEALDKVNEVLALGIRGLCRLISHDGLIKVDFADLCEVVRGRQAESFLAAAEAAGEGRGPAVLRALLESPFLDHGAALARAESVLVSIASGPGLSLKEIGRFMEELNRHCADHVQMVMGAEVDPDLGDRLLVTLIGTLPPPPEETPSAPSGKRSLELDAWDLDPAETDSPETSAPGASRRAREFTAPPPRLSPDQAAALLEQRGGKKRKRRRKGVDQGQGLLPLEVVAKGRFERSEPTRHRGEDLDTPTYIRRGIRLN